MSAQVIQLADYRPVTPDQAWLEYERAKARQEEVQEQWSYETEQGRRILDEVWDARHAALERWLKVKAEADKRPMLP